LPVDLVYKEEHPTQRSAIERERQLKRWSAQKKAAIVRGDSAELKRLSKRRTRKQRDRKDPQ
jgi:putative endonuclease